MKMPHNTRFSGLVGLIFMGTSKWSGNNLIVNSILWVGDSLTRYMQSSTLVIEEFDSYDE